MVCIRSGARKMQILLKIARGKSKSRNCEKCDKTFSNDGDLVNHTQEHIQDLHVNNKEVDKLASKSTLPFP